MNEQEWRDLDRHYRSVFSESIPRCMLPSDEAAAIALVCEAIDRRDNSIFERNVPPDALI